MTESPEVPEECPFIKTCSARVFKEQAEHVCLTSAWIYCDFINEKDLGKYKLSPKEWKEILEGRETKQ